MAEGGGTGVEEGGAGVGMVVEEGVAEARAGMEAVGVAEEGIVEDEGDVVKGYA